MHLSYTKGKYFKFYKDTTIHKILVEGKHQTQQLPFQWLKGNLGCGCLQHWELDLDCSSFTSDIFHARSQLYNTVIEASHYLRPMLSFKYSWKTHQIKSFSIFFALLRAVLNIHKYKNSVEISLIIF